MNSNEAIFSDINGSFEFNDKRSSSANIKKNIKFNIFGYHDTKDFLTFNKIPNNNNIVRNSLNNLLEIEKNVDPLFKHSPNLKSSTKSIKFKSSKALIENAHIYSDFKAERKDFDLKRRPKSPKILNYKKDNAPLLKLERDYYKLQKKAIESYLTGCQVDTRIIGMEYFDFIKEKQQEIDHYLLEKKIQHTQTPIEQIISPPKNNMELERKFVKLSKTKKKSLCQSSLTNFKEKKGLNLENLSIMKDKSDHNFGMESRAIKNLKNLSSTISQELNHFKNLHEKNVDDLYEKVKVHNRYFTGYMAEPNELFLGKKDLKMKNFSSKNKFLNQSNSISSATRKIFNFSKTKFFKSDLNEEKNQVKEESKTEELVGKITSQNKNLEKLIRENEEVNSKIDKLKRNIVNSINFKEGETGFFSAIKKGDTKLIDFYLIDNKNLVFIRDQVFLLTQLKFLIFILFL